MGRTRFCIHPEAEIVDIPSVGGTKEVNWDTCASLKPDLVVMDKEENTLPMAESCPFPWVATHITSIDNVGPELARLSETVGSDALSALAEGWQALAELPDTTFTSSAELPGFIRSIGDVSSFERLEYMIWRDPWMAISTQTFIGSMLRKVGLGDFLQTRDTPYPTLGEGELPRDNTLYLFSSEPFPFERYVEELESLGFNGALVDGEFYSWFGSRSYRQLHAFLTQQLTQQDVI